MLSSWKLFGVSFSSSPSTLYDTIPPIFEVSYFELLLNCFSIEARSLIKLFMYAPDGLSSPEILAFLVIYLLISTLYSFISCKLFLFCIPFILFSIWFSSALISLEGNSVCPSIAFWIWLFSSVIFVFSSCSFETSYLKIASPTEVLSPSFFIWTNFFCSSEFLITYSFLITYPVKVSSWDTFPCSTKKESVGFTANNIIL